MIIKGRKPYKPFPIVVLCDILSTISRMIHRFASGAAASRAAAAGTTTSWATALQLRVETWQGQG